MIDDIVQIEISEERKVLFESLKKQFNPESSKLRRYQHHLFDTLVEFDSFCKKHDIKYFLAYGTLLGAIRHKGFIPWDDDADLWMDRENYNKLETLMRGEHHVLTQKLSVAMGIRPELWSPPFAYIDIFIFDSCPDNKFFAWLKEWLIRFVYVMIKLRGRASSRKIDRYAIFLPLLPIALLRKIDDWKLIYSKIAQWCPRLFARSNNEEQTKNIQVYNETMSGLKRKYPRYLFSETQYADFEGYLFPIPSGYDSILKICYGNYMQIPDISHIHTHNMIDNIDI